MASKDKNLTREQQKAAKKAQKDLNDANRKAKRAKEKLQSIVDKEAKAVESRQSPKMTSLSMVELAKSAKKEPTPRPSRGRPKTAATQAAETALQNGTNTSKEHIGRTKDGAQKIRITTVKTETKTLAPPKKKGKKK